MSDIEIRPAALSEPAVRDLIAQALAELSRRYGGSGDATPIGADDFAAPNGAFFVAVRHGPPAAVDSPAGADSPAAVDSPAGAHSPTGAGSHGNADELVACAGWRRRGPDAELKRMFTLAADRGRGLGRRLLVRVEESARDAGCRRVILETGDRQPEAIALYESAGYTRIEDFGYYKDHAGVLSYAKWLTVECGRP